MKFYSIDLLLNNTKKIKNLDPKYYSILWVILKIINEDENIYNNITISPLWHKKEWEISYCKISIFGQSIYNEFIKIINNNIKQNISIDSIPFSIIWYEASKTGHIFSLKDEIQNSNSNFVWIKINFLSPTVVKANKIYQLFPSSQNYIYSLINKFEKILWKDKFFNYFKFNNTPKIQSLLEDGLIESDYSLDIEKIFIKGWYIPGNIGWIKYSINKKFDEKVFEKLKKNLNIFIKASSWTGLWFWTRLWLWQISWKTY